MAYLKPYLKVVIVGEPGVGKSNIYERFVKGTYNGSRAPTVGADFYVARVGVSGGQQVTAHLWDTAGQERFHAIANRIYLKAADGVILAYDVANRKSFERMDYWKRLVENCDTLPDKLVYLLIGNKRDLVDRRQVSVDEGQHLAERYSMLFMETSAQTGENVHAAITSIVTDIFEKRSNQKAGFDFPDNFGQSISLADNPKPDKVKSKCC